MKPPLAMTSTIASMSSRRTSKSTSRVLRTTESPNVSSPADRYSPDGKSSSDALARKSGAFVRRPRLIEPAWRLETAATLELRAEREVELAALVSLVIRR
jgi:hypothetical protein